MWSLQRWHRRRILSRHPIAEPLWQQVAGLPLLQRLTASDLDRLRELTTLFLHRKTITGAGGLQVDEEMALRIATQACLLILNLDLEWYTGWREVVVYPDRFIPEVRWRDAAGVEHRERQVRSGEAWQRGPVVLSWADIQNAARRDGRNVVIHEFMHKLDMLAGEANGMPPLHRAMSVKTWAQAFSRAYRELCNALDEGLPTDLDPYAGESPAEFLAVAAEAFMETPRRLHQGYPEVYEQLRQLLRQDPIAGSG